MYQGEVPYAAVVLCRTENGNLHSGLMYRTRRRGVEHIAFLHLGWNNYLFQDWQDHRLWAIPPVDPAVLRSVAGMCRRVLRAHQDGSNVPYFLRYQGSYFDGQGRLCLTPGARGLTCSTFVLAMFQSVQCQIVDEESWPFRHDGDLQFLLWLSAQFDQGSAHLDHVRAMYNQTDPSVRRIHPQEVLGACTASALPVDFDTANTAAIAVMHQLLDYLLP